MRSLVLVCVLAGAAHAAAPLDEERAEIAREHFQAAEQLASQQKYEQAIVELELANVALPLPSIERSIARLYEKLGANDKAIAAYQRYLAGDPRADDGPEVRVRIAQLQTKPAPAPAPTSASPAPPPARSRWIVPLAVLPVAAIALT